MEAEGDSTAEKLQTLSFLGSEVLKVAAGQTWSVGADERKGRKTNYLLDQPQCGGLHKQGDGPNAGAVQVSRQISGRVRTNS